MIFLLTPWKLRLMRCRFLNCFLIAGSITIPILWLVMSGLTCQPHNSISFYKSNGTIYFFTSQLKIQLDSELYWTIQYNKNGKWLSLNKFEGKDSLSLPSHYLQSDQKIITQFLFDEKDIKSELIHNEFGRGKRFILNGSYQDASGLAIHKKLFIELYEDFPDLAVTYAEYQNKSSIQDLELSEVMNACLQLDASLMDSNRKSNELCAFYGTAGRPIPLINGHIPPDVNLENFNGRPPELEGIKKGNGGLPVVDLWSREMGIGLACIEKKWKNLYLPIKVQGDGKVFTAIREIPGLNLDKPFILHRGETYRTVKTFVVVHSLDFYHPALRYSQIMQRLGLSFCSEYTSDDYLAAWCSWNDYCTRAMASKKDVMLVKPVMSRLNELKELGINLIIFDAGWFNNQGDWRPNNDPEAFPGGEEQLKAVINHIHQQGFKVMLWISFLTADPGSEVADQHPEWMIQKPDGKNHLDRWSGNTMCPSLPEVQQYHRQLARRLVSEYGADAFKVDGMYTCPPCYNPLHHHRNPNESCEDYDKVFQVFYEEAKSINPQVTIMECPCGTICNFATLPYISQTIAADPPDYITVRRYMKLYRALKGNQSPYSSDYTDVEEGVWRLPTAVGSGSIPQLFYGQTPDSSIFAFYKKWISIYHTEKISQSEYLNLYDIFYDRPETYVFRKKSPDGNIYYYSFFADDTSWSGFVTLRGLPEHGKYDVIDYVNGQQLTTISGYEPQINISFDNYLLIKCLPRKN